MDLQLDGVTYRGPAVDDPEILSRVGRELAALLTRINGFVAFSGGLHVRGACCAPAWHSLRAAWEGPDAIHTLFRSVGPDDIPFAQDALGDQYLLREGCVFRLSGESGKLAPCDLDVGAFLEAACADPVEFLDLAPLEWFWMEGGLLEPGQLLSAFPPFIVQESGSSLSLKAVPASDRLRFLADLAAQVRDLPDGARIQLHVVP